MKRAKKVAKKPLATRIEAIKEEADKELNQLSEKRRGILPAVSLRAMYLAKGGGNILEAYLAAIREGQ